MKKPVLLVAGAALLAAALPSCASSKAAEVADAPAATPAADAAPADAPVPAPAGDAAAASDGSDKTGEMSCGAGSCGQRR